MKLSYTLPALLIAMSLPTIAWADDLLSSANISSAYQDQPLVKKARANGLTSEIFRAIDKPATTMAQRAALIDAVVASNKTKDLSRRYTAYLTKRHKKTSLAQLSTPEAFALGWIRARETPKQLGPRKGKNEIERADPMMLLSAAANRMRGEMTINLLFATVKAQQALNQPKKAVCAPHECLDSVLRYHRKPKHWSLKAGAVCGIVKAVGKLSKPSALGNKLCRLKPGKVVAQLPPQTPTSTHQHKRFSHQLAPQAKQQVPMGIPGMRGMMRGIKPGAMGGNVDPRMMWLFLSMQRQMMGQMNHRFVPRQQQPGQASPKTIELKPNTSTPDTPPIAIDKGNTTTSPRQPNKEIILTPEATD